MKMVAALTVGIAAGMALFTFVYAKGSTSAFAFVNLRGCESDDVVA